jgi:hypothetical protein
MGSSQMMAWVVGVLFVSLQLLVGPVVAATGPSLAPEAAPAPEMVGAPGPIVATADNTAKAQSSSLPLDKIALPPGFQISLFTPNPVEANPRLLAINSPSKGQPSIVYVGTDAPAPDGVVRLLCPICCRFY